MRNDTGGKNVIGGLLGVLKVNVDSYTLKNIQINIILFIVILILIKLLLLI